MEEQPRLKYSQFIQTATAVIGAVALVLIAFGLLVDDRNQPEARGVTNFDSMTLSGDLVVGGASDLGGDVTFGGTLVPDIATIDNLVVATAAAIEGDLTVDGDTTLANTTVDGDLEVTGALALPDGLFPLGHDTGGEQLVYGTASITTTAVVDHSLTTVTFALCTLAQDPGTGSGDAAVCTVTVAADVVTVKAWQDDFGAATDTEVDVAWLVVGTP